MEKLLKDLVYLIGRRYVAVDKTVMRFQYARCVAEHILITTVESTVDSLSCAPIFKVIVVSALVKQAMWYALFL